MTTLIQRNSQVNDLDDFFDPDGDFLKDMSELDLLTILVAIKFPTLFDTSFLSTCCGFLNLIEEGHISMVNMATFVAEALYARLIGTSYIRSSKCQAYSMKDHHIAVYPLHEGSPKLAPTDLAFQHCCRQTQGCSDSKA